jgi:adenylate cyclase
VSSTRREDLWAVTAILVVTGVLLALRQNPTGGWAHLEDALYDRAHRHLLPAPAEEPGIAVVLVDDESLQRLGERWPIRRQTWARFLGTLQSYNPSAVLIDAWFEAPAPRGEVELALDLADAIRDGPLGELDPGEALATALDKKAATLDGDRQLSGALAKAGRVILGVMCKGGRRDTLDRGTPPHLRPLEGVSVPDGAMRCERLTGSVARLASAARGQASIALSLDPDGVIRRYPYFLGVRDQVFPSLALTAASMARPTEVEALRARALATDGGRPGLFALSPKAFRSVRFSDLMEVSASDSLRSALEGRLVFVGVSAQGTEDFVRTARGVDVPGVFVHATATAALLQGHFVRHESSALRWGALGGFALLLLIAALGHRFERTSALVAVTVLGAAVWAVVGWRALAAGYRIPVLSVWAGLLLWLSVRLIAGFRRAAEARRQATTIKRAFHQYLAPAVVEALMADPDKLRLGGERREITAFFSDIKGFTSLSEALPPSELVQVLNDCLGRMSTIIVEEGGIIDKYIGDAIVAMFGAPLEQPDHAARACRAALRCHAEMTRLRAEWAARDLPELHMRIGLNSGPALVGNMGSAQRFDYTMIGDSVNLAARLEGANGQYGTWLMCAEATAQTAAAEAQFRELDLMRPKGKKIPVRVFEILETRDAVHHRFAEGLEFYRAQRWDDALEVFRALADAGDAPSQTFVERIELFRDAPPAESWDGVFTMTTK